MKKVFYKNFKSEKGQALITLLFFVIIGITITTAAIVVLYLDNLAASTTEQGVAAYYAAESGAEEGYLFLLRNPQYATTQPTPFTETFSVGAGQAQVSVNSGVVTSKGIVGSGNIIRKIQIQTSYNNGTFSLLSWKEIN